MPVPAPLTAPRRAPQVGLLLGFPDETGLWVTVSGDSVRGRPLDVLVVPRASGFWRVASSRVHARTEDGRCDVAVARATVDSVLAIPDSLIDERRPPNDRTWHEVWAAPVGTPPSSVATLTSRACLFSDTTAGLVEATFIGVEHLSFDRRSIGLDEEERFDSLWDPAATLAARLDSLPDQAHGYLPDVPLATQLEWLARCRREGAEELTGVRLESSWGIVREPGRWRLVRRFGYEFDAGLAFYECPIDFRLPSDVVGHDSLAIPIEAIYRAMPAATDAFSAPDGRVIAVMDRGRLHLFRVTAGGLGKKLGDLPLPSPTSAVLIQWTDGTHVNRWTRELMSIPSRAR